MTLQGQWAQAHLAGWILVSKYHSPLKGIRLFGEMDEPRSRAEKLHDKFGVSIHSASKYWSTCSKNENMSCQMDRKIALRLSTGQSWHNFYKKLNNDQSKLLSMEHKKIYILIILKNNKVGGRREDPYL